MSTIQSKALPLTTAALDLAERSSAWAGILEAQNVVLQHIIGRTKLDPADEPLRFSTDDAGASIAAWQPGRDGSADTSAVRWVSAGVFVNKALGFGSTRLMAFNASTNDVPHYVLELILLGPGKVQGTVSFAQRSDLVLDLKYLERYYNTPGVKEGDQNAPTPSFNQIYNACAERQESHRWIHYATPQCDMKPVISNSISYSFSAEDDANIEAFGKAAMNLARRWAELVIEFGGARKDMLAPKDNLAAYDARYVEVVRQDPGNAISTKLFGTEATAEMIAATVGQKI